MKATLVLIFVFSLIITYVVYAGDKPTNDKTSAAALIDKMYETYMSKGKTYMQEKKYSEAATEFRAAIKIKPSDEAANLNLGVALNRLSETSAQTHLKKALALKPDNPQTNLELGLYYYTKNVYAEARDYFENAADFGKGTEYGAKAQEYLKKIDRHMGEKPWYVNFSLGTQYDSNVVLSHSDTALPLGISRRADWKEIAYLHSRYKLVDTDSIETYAGYSFYQTMHHRLSAFNITQNTLDLSLKYNALLALSVGAQYAFEYILVGGKAYDHAHSIGPSFFISEGNGFNTELRYRYRNTRFYNGDLFSDNSDRNGADNSIGILQIFPLGGTANLEIGYAFNKADAQKVYWRYTGNKLHANLMYQLPYKIFMNLYGEYYSKRYDGLFPTDNKGRDDDTQTYSLTATKLLTDNMGVTLGQTYVYNKSNITSYDYKRNLSSLLFNVRF
ncbi:MAG: tetratricopeptide repeat protein [Nitrospirae bacterium]|nr:tetratricopeptide repeat protein [Nitrospirota bacterium]